MKGYLFTITKWGRCKFYEFEGNMKDYFMSAFKILKEESDIDIVQLIEKNKNILLEYIKNPSTFCRFFSKLLERHLKYKVIEICYGFDIKKFVEAINYAKTTDPSLKQLFNNKSTKYLNGILAKTVLPINLRLSRYLVRSINSYYYIDYNLSIPIILDIEEKEVICIDYDLLDEISRAIENGYKLEEIKEEMMYEYGVPPYNISLGSFSLLELEDIDSFEDFCRFIIKFLQKYKIKV